MADLIREYSTSGVSTKDMGQVVDDMVRMEAMRRVGFERKWYNNNFFDDGYHYRFFSRPQNKIIDIAAQSTIYAPLRAIPKASRQLRGVANLLIAPDYVPVVFPEKVEQTQYADPQLYQDKLQQAKDYAHKVGRWVIKEWEYQDLIEKLAFMVILTGKHGVSWMQVWPDAIEEAIKTQVYDAFDIYVLGNLTDPYDSPYMIKTIPRLISEIKADENFDQEQIGLIGPDNKFANSEIKQAYLSTRLNRTAISEHASTLIQKEAFIKEYLNRDNMAKIRLQDDGERILKERKEGDVVIRQVFVVGNVWLRDRYVNLPEYPFVDYRMEPGPIYQVPLIERFISQNKSLDALVSRAERYSHTMVAGSWSQRLGEKYEITNDAGGQVMKYQTTPPVQNAIAPIPAFFFQLISLLGSLIEEQGVSTSTLGKLPTGVRANAAIESLKESEYANLVIASRRLKKTVQKITERMFDIADNHFIKPKTVYDMKNGNPVYFNVIGAGALEGRKKLKVDTPSDVIPLKKDYKVEIEVQTGIAYTKEGQKAAAKELGDYLIQLGQLQVIDPEVAKVFFKKMLELYQFGPTEELSEVLDNPAFASQVSDDQLKKMQIAILQALKDAGEVGQEASQRRVMENKVGILEALQESGLVDNMRRPNVPQGRQVSESLSYKDAPEDVKRQIEAQAGLIPSQGISPAATEQLVKHNTIVSSQLKGGQGGNSQSSPA